MRRFSPTLREPSQHWVNRMSSFSKRSGKRFSVFGGGGMKSSKRQGGSCACQISIPLLGGSWAVLALIFPHFFAFVFNIDFFSILEGVWEGFGRPKWFQNRDFWYFLGYVCGDLIFGRILLDFFIKSMVKNIGIFDAFPTRRFVNCWLNLLISSMLET